jgi:hypothetical protein
MSEGVESVIVPHPSTEGTKPVEGKSKRDSAVIIPSDEESSSLENTDATESDESEESEEGEAGKESPVRPEHEEHEVEKEDKKPEVMEAVEHKDDTKEVVAPNKTEVDEEEEMKREENDDAKKKEMEIPALIEPEHKSEETAKNEEGKDGDEKEAEDGVDDDSISTIVETGEPIEDVPLKQTEGGDERKIDEEKVEEERAEEKKIAEKPEENEDYESVTREEDKPVVEDKEIEITEPEDDKDAKEDFPKIEEEKKEENTAVEEGMPKEAFLEHETGAIPEPTIAETAEKASEVVLPEPKEPATTEAEPSLENEKDEEKDVEGSAKQVVPETPLEPEMKLDLPQPLPITSKAAPTQLQISKAKFRQALNMLVQLLSEAEDDEGVVRLNLNDRESELRKVVRMLGKRLEGLEDVEREVEWIGLVGEFEKRGREE